MAPPPPPPPPTSEMDSCTAEVNVDVVLMVDVTTRVHDTSGAGGGGGDGPGGVLEAPAAGAPTDVTVTLNDAGSSASPDACCSRRPCDTGLHAAPTLDSALALGVTLTGSPPFLPHETTAVGTSELLDLTTNTSSPIRSVALSTATLTSAM